MSLADDLNSEVQKRLVTPSIPEPKVDYKPHTEFDGNHGFIQTGGLEVPPSYTELLEFFGYDPKEVKIIGEVRQSRWQTYDERWLTSYRFAIGPAATSNIDDLMTIINAGLPVDEYTTIRQDGDVFHLLLGDLQLGKVDGDGTEGIVRRFLISLNRAADALAQFSEQRPIKLVHIAFLGDCIEGNQSQNGKNMWRTSLTLTEQIRLLRRLMLEAVNVFVDAGLPVEVDVVNGNHDEVQRFQQTRADDGHATEAAVALSDALEMNPERYGHVRIFVPNKDEWTITRDVGGTVMTMAHGHQWRKGARFDWWAKQTLNLQSASEASFLVHGHTHEFEMNSKRDRTALCVPTFESESTWWRHKAGDMARPGAVVMLTNGTEWSDVTIV